MLVTTKNPKEEAHMTELVTFEEYPTSLIEDETTRIYTFALGMRVVLENVVEVAATPSGMHRVKTRHNGKTTLHIIPAGWIHIEIETPSGEWSF